MEELLKEFYVREINVNIFSFWDAGWEIRIGDVVTGETHNFDSVNAMKNFMLSYLEKLPPLDERELQYIEK